MEKKFKSVKAVGHELKNDPPAIVTKMKKKYGAKKAESVRRAILMSKARRSGLVRGK